MIQARSRRLSTVILAMALALALSVALAGCGSKSGDDVPKVATAKSGVAVAKSALSTMAPDAKLLLVETAQPVTTTSTPVWAYLFGSPKTDKTFAVYVSGGKAMGASEYGAAGLDPAEWKNIPGTDAWKIDSDSAYTKAVAASGAKGDPAGYSMGLVTYVPESVAASSTSRAFVWYVVLEPGASGATTNTIEIDAESGKALTK